MVTLLFESIRIAKEIAFYLRGNWDGCNAVSFEKNIINNGAFRTALELAGGSVNSYCWQRAVGYININQAEHISIRRKLDFVLTGFRRFALVAQIKINNGFQLALEQGLFKPNKELTNKIETFCDYLESGMSKIKASQKAKLSWFVIVVLEDLGNLI